MAGTATALLEAPQLRSAIGVRRLGLKLESTQPTGSFKDRGMRALCEHHKTCGAARVISSSGGNAGLAATFAAVSRGMTATVVVPTTTKPLMLAKIKAAGGDVIVHGANWNAADQLAREMCAADPEAAYVPPFDHPKIWAGNASLVAELVEQRGKVAPDVIVASVGGGGLLAGILQGLRDQGGEWASKTKVIAAETEGAASMAAALLARRPVPIASISSVATSLGALQVAQGALDLALAHPGGCESRLVSDAQAVQGCVDLADHIRVLAEPACGAALAATRAYVASLGEGVASNLDVVVVVCGGSAITLDMLAQLQAEFAARGSAAPGPSA